MFAMQIALRLGTLAAATSQPTCSSHATCNACAGISFCGWCSPGPVVYKNHTKGTRCADQRDKASWDCPGIYTTEKCTMGYTCNATMNYTCTEAGMGEGSFASQAACTAGCKKPNEVYKCDPATVTCKLATAGGGSSLEACKSTCSKDSYTCNRTAMSCIPAPPGSGESKAICQAGCGGPPKPPPPPPKPPPKPHPSPPTPPPTSFYSCNKTATMNYTCTTSHGDAHAQSQAMCQARCKKPTPQPKTPTNLVGYWRGFQIQKGFKTGEFDFDFKTAACTLYDADKKATTATVQSVTDPATLGTEVWLTVGGKLSKGLIKYASNSPETFVGIFAFGGPGAETPASVSTAMTSSGATVYLVQKCLNPASGCSFRPPTAAVIFADLDQFSGDAEHDAEDPFDFSQTYEHRQLTSTVADECNQYASCKDCILHKDHCGWCSVPVKYKDPSTQPAQCAGFDTSGKPDPPWTCPAMYKRTDCADFICDQKPGAPGHAGNATCREAGPGEHGEQSKELCELACKAPPPTPPTPPPPPPTPPKPTPPANKTNFVCDPTTNTCHNSTITGGQSLAACQASCKKQNHSGYECSPMFTCVASPVGGESKEACTAGCKAPPKKPGTPPGLIGQWRGVGVHAKYTYGEWDGKFTAFNFSFTSAGGKQWAAAVSTDAKSPLAFDWSAGPLAGQHTEAIYEISSGPDGLQHAAIAIDVPGYKAATWSSAEAKGTVLFLAECGTKMACGT